MNLLHNSNVQKHSWCSPTNFNVCFKPKHLGPCKKTLVTLTFRVECEPWGLEEHRWVWGWGVPGFQCPTDDCGGHWASSSLLPHQLPVTYPFFLSDWHLRPYTPHRCVHTSLEIWGFPERLCKDPLPLFINFSLWGLQIIMGAHLSPSSTTVSQVPIY